MQDNPIAVQTWREISDCFRFLAEHQDLYTDVTSVSKIGVISPPHIPSFEVTLRRDNLYNALAESNVMYDVVLLHRLSSELLSRYKVIVIPNIPWMDDNQVAAIRRYKNNGGKIYTIGSTRELRELADVQSPATVLEEAQTATGRRELLSKLDQLSGKPLIQLDGTNYVAANVVKKTGNDRVIVHFVNYDKPLKNVRAKVNLDGVVKQIDIGRVKLSPLTVGRGQSKLLLFAVRGWN